MTEKQHEAIFPPYVIKLDILHEIVKSYTCMPIINLMWKHITGRNNIVNINSNVFSLMNLSKAKISTWMKQLGKGSDYWWTNSRKMGTSGYKHEKLKPTLSSLSFISTKRDPSSLENQRSLPIFLPLSA